MSGPPPGWSPYLLVWQRKRSAIRIGAGAPLAGAPLDDLVAENHGAIDVGQRDLLARAVVEVHDEVVLHAAAGPMRHQRHRVPLGLGFVIVGIAPKCFPTAADECSVERRVEELRREWRGCSCRGTRKEERRARRALAAGRARSDGRVRWVEGSVRAGAGERERVFARIASRVHRCEWACDGRDGYLFPGRFTAGLTHV